MSNSRSKKKIWGWFFFDWASQPYPTLIVTFIFSPYIKELLQDGTKAQIIWGYNLAVVGVLIAILSPLLGAAADYSGRRLPWIRFFSLFYVLGSVGLWWSEPGNFNLLFVLASFAVGLIGLEFTTLFCNALMPDLVEEQQLGKISGAGWAFGYSGGVLALLLMLCFFAQGSDGNTYLGINPIFGLDANSRQGTRFVGPFAALWYLVFMIPFFAWVKEKPAARATSLSVSLAHAWPQLRQSLRQLPRRSKLLAFLISSMLYRDALSATYTFGGIYAVGVLEWSVVDTGIFGILATISGALAAWLGGKIDQRIGSYKVVMACIPLLGLTILGIALIKNNSIAGIQVSPESPLPDFIFYGLGSLIGATGGALQASSRALMVRQASAGHIGEVCGLYTFAGKATSFLAPLLIASITKLTGSQQWGITPLLLLLLVSWWFFRRVSDQGSDN